MKCLSYLRLEIRDLEPIVRSSLRFYSFFDDRELRKQFPSVKEFLRAELGGTQTPRPLSFIGRQSAAT